MACTERPDIAALAEEIRCYLLHHPRAADSAAGVLRWWLLRQRLDDSRENVERALEHLATTGQVTMRTTADGTVIYAASRAGS